MEPDPALAAVKTYNYLRIALAALVLLLYTSVVLEWWAAGRCLQSSISAYYYTPVHAVFIGVLVTMGVCLVALKGNTDGEDVLMNLAGLLAPGVAFIPTPGAEQCSSAPLITPDIPAAVANNMPALFVTGLVAGVFAVVIARREGGMPASARSTRRASRSRWPCSAAASSGSSWRATASSATATTSRPSRCSWRSSAWSGSTPVTCRRR